MKFIVTYIFNDNDDEGVQVDIVNANSKNECESSYKKVGYTVLKVEEYNEAELLEELYPNEELEVKHETEETDYNYQYNEGADIFPNADSIEELEEELEHSFSKMMDR